MSSILRFVSPLLPSPLLLAAFLTPAALTAQAQRPRGEWRLDAAHSDTLPARYARSLPRDSIFSGERPAREGGRGEPGESHYGGGRRYRGAGSDDLARMRQTVDLVRTAPERLRISPDARTLTLIDSAGAEVVWPIDGKKVSETLAGGATVERRVRWKGDALVIERKVSGGGKVIETFRLGLGGTRLLVFVEVDGLFQPLEFRRLYESADRLSVGSPGDSTRLIHP
jgi:hypothetical protein